MFLMESSCSSLKTKSKTASFCGWSEKLWVVLDQLWITANRERERELKGVPIGNLTSQIFANIYLNELDQFVKHTLRVKHYFRYADDFIIVHQSEMYLR